MSIRFTMIQIGFRIRGALTQIVTRTVYNSKRQATRCFRTGHLHFGAGRRIYAVMCAPKRASILAFGKNIRSFNIRTAIYRATGKIQMLDLEKLTQGFVCMHEPYHADITRRVGVSSLTSLSSRGILTSKSSFQLLSSPIW